MARVVSAACLSLVLPRGAPLAPPPAGAAARGMALLRACRAPGVPLRAQRARPRRAAAAPAPRAAAEDDAAEARGKEAMSARMAAAKRRARVRVRIALQPGADASARNNHRSGSYKKQQQELGQSQIVQAAATAESNTGLRPEARRGTGYARLHAPR